MKSIILVLLITSLSCSVSKMKTKNKYKNVSLIGEWTDFYHPNLKSIIINDDSSIYTFSKTDGGSLLEIGRYINNDTILVDNNYELTNHVIRKNENKILIGNYDLKYYNIYNRIIDSNYKENLKRYFKQDSVRSELIGWWKMDKAKSQQFEFKFQEIGEFTINFSRIGAANIYENHNLNDENQYSFMIRENFIELKRGCEISHKKIIEVNDSVLKILWFNQDTLHFDKVNYLN